MAAWTPRISLSPSSASRWLKCTASPAYLVKEHDRLKKNDTVFNMEGDHAHCIADHVLRGVPIPESSKRGVIPVKDIPEMKKNALAFKQFCLEDGPLEWMTEQEVPLFYKPDSKGYIDFISIQSIDGDRLRIRIVDYKYGKGVAVSAEGNSQMAIYARSYIEAFIKGHWLYKITPDSEIVMDIFQPRVRDGAIESSWSINYEDLLNITDEVEKTAKVILSKEASSVVFNPSRDACRFCPASEICDAKNGGMVKTVKSVVPAKTLKQEKPVFPDPDSLTDAQIAEMLRVRTPMKAWLDSIYIREFGKALEGNIMPGFKLVRGRGSNKWDAPELVEDELVELLGDEAFESTKPKLVSTNKALTSLRAKNAPAATIKRIKSYIEKTAGQPLLVHESDPRKSFGPVRPEQVMEFITDDLDDEE